jgi:peptidoglycan/LPS O-acetylase OafA/YrhL
VAFAELEKSSAARGREEPLWTALGRFDCLRAGSCLQLDGMRGVLCLAVLYSHFGAFWMMGRPFPMESVATRAVYGFFALSGVLIMRILLKDRAEVATGRLRRKDAWTTFNLRRARRLWPVYGIVLAVCLLTDMPGVRQLWPWFVTMTVNYPLALKNLWATCALAHFWSLAVEEHFYFIAAPLVLFARGRVTAVVAVLFAVVAVWWRWAVFSEIGDGGLASRVSHGCLDLPLVGCLYAWAHSEAAPRLARRLLWAAGLAGLAGWALPPEYVSNWWQGYPLFYATMLPVMVALGCALTLMVLWAKPPVFLGWLMNLPPLRWVGLRCYGIYAWHFAILSLVPWAASRWDRGMSRFWQGITALVLTLVVAALSWTFIEYPMMRRRKEVKSTA